MIRIKTLKILFFSDTHLGFDYPIRPRVQRRRRGEDFFANYQRVLDYAISKEVDVVIHGGDLFFRSRIPAKIVDLAYNPLLEFADAGIPIVIVPGNHERSNLPPSLFLGHPSIHVIVEPMTVVFDPGPTISISGFPSVRNDIKRAFTSILSSTGWSGGEADIRLLCMHQAVEGSKVGPADFTFRHGQDVVQMKDIPAGLDAVLCGHIHRAQILRDEGRPPVIFCGSTERTSFAEMDEEKGFYILSFAEEESGWILQEPEFIGLPSRPMIDIWLGCELTREKLSEYLVSQLTDRSPDSLVRFRSRPGLRDDVRAMMTAAYLKEVMPHPFDYRVSSEFFNERQRRGAKNGRRGEDISGEDS